MKIIESGSLWVPKLCVEIQYTPGAMAQAIACVEDNNLLAGTVYDHYNGSTVNAHILVKGVPSRLWWVAIFDYPFNVLKVRKLVGQVSSTHYSALKLNKRFGFAEEARVKDFYAAGEDLVILTMTRDQCKVLNDPMWRSVVEQVRK